MRETLNERRRARSGEADGESDVLAKIAEMPEADRVMAKRLHAIINALALIFVMRRRAWGDRALAAAQVGNILFSLCHRSAKTGHLRSGQNQPPEWANPLSSKRRTENRVAA
jgi:hypothetical protein